MDAAEIIQIQHEENAGLKAQVAEMAEQISVLTQQLDWFKRQIFGRKSEKQLIDTPHQPDLFGFEKEPELPVPTTEVKSHRRKSNKTFRGDEVNDAGLRFDVKWTPSSRQISQILR